VHIKYGEIHHRLGSGQSLAARPPQSISEDLLKKRMHPAVAQIDRAGLPPFNSTLTGKINPFFGCDVRDLVLTYAFNYSLPWTVLAPEVNAFIQRTVKSSQSSCRPVRLSRYSVYHQPVEGQLSRARTIYNSRY
jgi:hypothetical protein